MKKQSTENRRKYTFLFKFIGLKAEFERNNCTVEYILPKIRTSSTNDRHDER